jgi:hypothetical protein
MPRIDRILKSETEDSLQNIEVPASLYAFAQKVPEMVNQNKTFNVLKTKNKRWNKQLLSWGAAAAMITFAISLSSSVTANFFENVPFLKMEDNDGFRENFSNLLDAAKNKQFTSIGQSAEDNGIEMIVTDAIYDGTQVALSLSLQTSDELEVDKIASSNMKILFNGEKLSWSSVQDFSKVDQNKYTGAMKIWVPEENLLEESINVDIQFSKVLGHEGKWKYDLNLDKVRQSFQTDTSIQLANTSLYINEVSFTPLNTEISIIGENKENLVVSLVDSKGDKLSTQNFYESGRDKILQYKPFSKIPDKLNLEVSNGTETELIVIPFNK